MVETEQKVLIRVLDEVAEMECVSLGVNFEVLIFENLDLFAPEIELL